MKSLNMWNVAVVYTGSRTRKFSKWKLFVVFCVKKILIVSFEKRYNCSALPDFQWFDGLKLIDNKEGGGVN